MPNARRPANTFVRHIHHFGAAMYPTLTLLVESLAGASLSGTEVIRWGAPVPAFGDPTKSTVATLGLNPSNKEFLDDDGRELRGSARRFHTLASLGIASWSDADARHLELVQRSCQEYFRHNPYDRWFRRLDSLIHEMGVSYYQSPRRTPINVACHLDLIPYATHRKWVELTSNQRSRLLRVSGHAFGVLLRDSPIQIVVLNGQSVVDHFQTLTESKLERIGRPTWQLPRSSGQSIGGYSYHGVVSSIGDVTLGRDVVVVGYNHNIQSSFGVTTKVVDQIAEWLGGAVLEIPSEAS
jgi:hypothetical protein